MLEIRRRELMMKRRTFITLLGGVAAWPLAAHAQPSDRARRIGVLMFGDENDPMEKRYVAAFTQGLAGLGWTDPQRADGPAVGPR